MANDPMTQKTDTSAWGGGYAVGYAIGYRLGSMLCAVLDVRLHAHRAATAKRYRGRQAGR